MIALVCIILPELPEGKGQRAGDCSIAVGAVSRVMVGARS